MFYFARWKPSKKFKEAQFIVLLPYMAQKRKTLMEIHGAEWPDMFKFWSQTKYGRQRFHTKHVIPSDFLCVSWFSPETVSSHTHNGMIGKPIIEVFISQFQLKVKAHFARITCLCQIVRSPRDWWDTAKLVCFHQLWVGWPQGSPLLLRMMVMRLTCRMWNGEYRLSKRVELTSSIRSEFRVKPMQTKFFQTRKW